MLTSKTIRTVTDMRKDADGLLELVSKIKNPIGIMRHNKLEAYIIDSETLESLEGLVEDYLDAQLVESRINDKRGFRDLEEFWKKSNLPR